jgi:hypothetical protein
MKKFKVVTSLKTCSFGIGYVGTCGQQAREREQNDRARTIV